MTDAYDSSQNTHSFRGAEHGLALLTADGVPRSILDVGCGPGYWLQAAKKMGVANLQGIDFNIPNDLDDEIAFTQADLGGEWDLKRKFDLVLCLEVAEHLLPQSSESLIKSLTSHGDHIYFSAACPGQYGQNHINCQWPSYWQRLFNDQQFICDDTIRWNMWDQAMIEPWYRQNIFCARRDPTIAGKEPRIRSVVHPDIAAFMRSIPGHIHKEEQTRYLSTGHFQFRWYLKSLLNAFVIRLTKTFKRSNESNNIQK